MMRDGVIFRRYTAIVRYHDTSGTRDITPFEIFPDLSAVFMCPITTQPPGLGTIQYAHSPSVYYTSLPEYSPCILCIFAGSHCISVSKSVGENRGNEYGGIVISPVGFSVGGNSLSHSFYKGKMLANWVIP